jgi:signal transduction histidine kinase
MPPRHRLAAGVTPWAYALVCAPLVLLFVECLRGAIAEVGTIRKMTLRDEAQRVRAQALSRAEGLKVLMEEHQAADQSWATIRDQPWLTRYWSRFDPTTTHQPYAAVVDDTGAIVMHTDPARVGKRLERGWYDRRVTEAGPDVVRIEQGVLSGERPVFDVTVPLTVEGNWVGDYHEGLDAHWLDSRVQTRERSALLRWLGVLALVTAVNVAAVAALRHLASRQARLWKSLQNVIQHRTRELAQLGSGLAHEIRNPLHALRINLHTLRRALSGRSALPEEQIVATIQESDGAIDRLDGLMRDLVLFADPGRGDIARVDVASEVRSSVSLLAEEFRRQEIDLRAKIPSVPATVAIDPTRFRQVLLNLLTFAQHRAGKCGTIHLEVAPRDEGVEIAVDDGGPALTDEARSRLFEPFQAPGETGTSLGLALVQAFIEEAGGRVGWQREAPHGDRCRLWLPLAPSAHNGGRS